MKKCKLYDYKTKNMLNEDKRFNQLYEYMMLLINGQLNIVKDNTIYLSSPDRRNFNSQI